MVWQGALTFYKVKYCLSAVMTPKFNKMNGRVFDFWTKDGFIKQNSWKTFKDTDDGDLQSLTRS